MVYVIFCFVRLYSHVDHGPWCDLEGHANGDSQKVYLDLTTVRNRSKIIAPVHLQRHIEEVRYPTLYAYEVMPWRHVTYVIVTIRFHKCQRRIIQ